MNLSGFRFRAVDLRLLTALFVCLFFLVGSDSDDCNNKRGTVTFQNDFNHLVQVFVWGPNNYRESFGLSPGKTSFLSLNLGTYEYLANNPEFPQDGRKASFVIDSYAERMINLR